MTTQCQILKSTLLKAGCTRFGSKKIKVRTKKGAYVGGGKYEYGRAKSHVDQLTKEQEEYIYNELDHVSIIHITTGTSIIEY